MMDDETTDITLFVRTSTEEMSVWNRQRIIDALLRETKISWDIADEISRDVEKQIIGSGISLLTAPLIRELVDAKLIERGMEQVRKMHARLGLPIYDVGKLILLGNKENANLPHGPEGTNLILAEGIKREYALLDVFSNDVSEAHVRGDIHLHGLGRVDRPYSSCQSLEYVKKFGINLPNATTVAKPARHAGALLSHMVRFSTTLQGHFAGVIGWDAVNFSFAPFLVSMNKKEILQLAQMLVYEFSQLTSARGGQAMFTDIHIYWNPPPYLAGVSAIGPAGEDTEKPYSAYLEDARKFALALFEVFLKGDARGMPFIFPRPLVHIDESFFKSSGHRGFLDLISKVAGEKGNTCFVFDRGDWLRSSCGSHKLESADSSVGLSGNVWERRSFVMQNVTLNLPRLAYQAQGGHNDLMSRIKASMELAAEAHSQKRAFMEKLLSYGDKGPLSVLTSKNDGSPYLNMNKTVYLIGVIGLNELVQIHKGQQLHQSKDALSFGLEITAYMEKEARRLGKTYGMNFLLEQTPAESTAYRFARLDLKYFSPRAGHFVKGNLAAGEVYYTNSTRISVHADISPMERIMREGKFHPLIKGGAMTNVWLGDYLPKAEEISEIVINAFKDTHNEHVVFSPEFTYCPECRRATRGTIDKCPVCESLELDKIARITQYFSMVSGWNKGKIAELRDRKKISALKNIN